MPPSNSQHPLSWLHFLACTTLGVPSMVVDTTRIRISIILSKLPSNLKSNPHSHSCIFSIFGSISIIQLHHADQHKNQNIHHLLLSSSSISPSATELCCNYGSFYHPASSCSWNHQLIPQSSPSVLCQHQLSSSHAFSLTP